MNESVIKYSPEVWDSEIQIPTILFS